MSGCIRRRSGGGIASLRFQLRDQPLNSPRERLHVALGHVLAERPEPLAVRGAQLVDRRAAFARELHARRAQVVRVVAPLRESELLEARRHAGHVLLRDEQLAGESGERHRRVRFAENGEDGPLLRRDFRFLENRREPPGEQICELNDADDEIAFCSFRHATVDLLTIGGSVKHGVPEAASMACHPEPRRRRRTRSSSSMYGSFALCGAQDDSERKIAFPANAAASPSSSSIRSSWLYFAMRSLRDAEPVLICPAFVATARSAIVESSVSPERCEITERYPARFAISIASSVSLSVPIWLTLIRIALAIPREMPFAKISVFVTYRS